MATRRVPHRDTPPQSARPEDALEHVNVAQAAAWLLDQLHQGELAGIGLERCSRDPRHDPELEQIRAHLTRIAIDATRKGLGEARRLLEAGRGNQEAATCVVCGGPACPEDDRCGGCGQIVCDRCDQAPDLLPRSFPGDRYPHPHRGAGNPDRP